MPLSEGAPNDGTQVRRASRPSGSTGRDWLSFVETPDLAALVPNLMARYPHFAWSATGGHVKEDELVVEMHPHARPERVATIKVNPHAEVYFLSFGGHGTAPEFAYEDEDKREVLEDLIRDAVALAIGPTRITRRTIDGLEVSSSLEFNPDGPESRSFGVSFSSPIAYTKALLRGRRTTKEVIDFPSIASE